MYTTIPVKYLIMKALILILFLSTSLTAFPQQETIPLYSGKAPGSESWDRQPGETVVNGDIPVEYNIIQPTLTVYPARGPVNTGTSVIIAPGGGYFFLAVEHEGSDVAERLSALGVTAFVLRYRVVQTEDLMKEVGNAFSDQAIFEETVAPVIELAGKDGMQAVQWVRENAEAYGLNPDRIGFMGFSAGGGVTMSVAYKSEGQNQPDFIAPIYAYLPESLSSLPVPDKKMPAFVVVAANDEMKLATTSFDIYSKWIAAGQEAELHAYEKGGHGFGMRIQELPSDTWLKRFEDWLASRGLLWPAHPVGWAATTTYQSRKRWLDQQQALMSTDWPNLGRYAAENEKLSPPEKGESRVVFMGNSITEGWKNVVPEFFKGKPYVNRGIGGQTTPQMLARFRQDVIELDPDVVVILAGTNDIAGNTGPISLEDIFGNLVSMTELARANGIRVVLSSVLPAYDYPWSPGLSPNEKIPELNRMIRNYAEKEGIVYLDYFQAMADEKNGLKDEYGTDGVHPNLMGYKVMEPLAEAAIKKALEK